MFFFQRFRVFSHNSIMVSYVELSFCESFVFCGHVLEFLPGVTLCNPMLCYLQLSVSLSGCVLAYSDQVSLMHYNSKLPFESSFPKNLSQGLIG